jgi:nucleotide-binding universal stress UspA family protein
MNTSKRIVLLTDFSEVSENAAAYAMLIAKKTQSEVEILHIVSTPVDWVKLPKEKESLYPEVKHEISRAKTNMNELESRFSAAGIAVKKSLEFNVGIEDVPKNIPTENVDMIIMGSHGTKGFKDFTLGSNAQKVLRNSLVPVLVVKDKPTSTIGEIVFASTFVKSQVSAFERLLNFARLFGSKISWLLINTPYNFLETPEIEERFRNFAENSGIEKHVFCALNEERGITEFLKTHPADILTMVTEGKSGFTQLFFPSLTEIFANDLNTAILSLRMGEHD